MTTDVAEVITAWLVSALSLRRGDRVLEIAGGSGTVSFAAAATGQPTYVVCTDVEMGAVSIAAHRHRAASGVSRDRDHLPSAMAFVVADMRRLPFPADEFDSLVCRWGLMFASDPVATLVEARRVLRPSGRLAFSVWGPPEDNPWQSILDDELEASGIEDRSAQHRPGGMFALADESALREIVAEAGFSLDLLERVSLSRRYGDFAEYWSKEVDLEIERSARLRALRRRLQTRLGEYLGHRGYEIPGLNIAVLATRPRSEPSSSPTKLTSS